MKIDYLSEKGSREFNEDAFLIGKNIFGVFDGASSLDKRVFDEGKTGGWWASNIAKEAFVKNDAPLIELATEANDKIRQKMIEAKVNLSLKEYLWCTSAAVIRFLDNSFEWLQIADSVILLVYENGEIKLPTRYYDHDLDELKKWQEMAKSVKKDLWEKSLPSSRLRRQDMNVKDYGFINGEASFTKFLYQGKQNLAGIKYFLICTDGFFIPKANPSDPEGWQLLVDKFVEGGLPSVGNYIREIEKSDPNCLVYPRFKQHDDMTAIAITL